MYCAICSLQFDFANKKGVSYRNKPICAECLLNLTIIFLDMHRDGLKRYLGKEVKLQYFEQ